MTINPQFTISIQEDTNKIIGSSEEKFIGIRPGSLIKIDNEQTLYTILNSENYFYLKSFNTSGPKTLIIEDDIGVNLQKGDSIQISFKEYELILITDILNEGHSYDKESTLTIDGGDLCIDIASGVGDSSILKIMEVGNEGQVKQVGIKNKGRYLVPPANPVKVISNNGTGAEFQLKYNECDNRSILERNIVNINFKDNKSYITLDYSLPLNLKSGKLSCQKSFLTLDSNYRGPTQNNVTYQIYRDFTPSCHLPLMVRGSLSPEVVYNKAILQIDEELRIIKDKLGIK